MLVAADTLSDSSRVEIDSRGCPPSEITITFL